MICDDSVRDGLFLREEIEDMLAIQKGLKNIETGRFLKPVEIEAGEPQYTDLGDLISNAICYIKQEKIPVDYLKGFYQRLIDDLDKIITAKIREFEEL